MNYYEDNFDDNNTPIPYTLDHVAVINFPLILTDEGEIAVAHFIECIHCKMSYPAYINMSFVIADTLPYGICINCNGEGLEIITYKLLYNPPSTNQS